MKTEILQIDGRALERSAEIIRSGGAVAFPTETVYGLGANAFDDAAVKKIFEIKGRPSDNPLIVHVHKGYDLSALVSYIPDYSVKLAKAFLPGPLTMVYKSEGKVSPAVSCGLDTLAVRIPSHPAAQKFLEYVNLPIAAPSANISKHVSPVTAQHVYDDLCGKIEVILDGGKCTGGIESTVLDCTKDVPVVLRSGLISREMIASVVGKCEEYVPQEGERVPSPGMKYRHYSPKCKTALFAYERREEAYRYYLACLERGERAYFMCEHAVASQFDIKNLLDLGANEGEIASNLYDKLREGEAVADIIVAVEPLKKDGIMTGVMNRMKKAFG